MFDVHFFSRPSTVHPLQKYLSAYAPQPRTLNSEPLNPEPLNAEAYPLGSRSFIFFLFVLSTVCLCRSARLRFVVFFVKIWLAFDFENINLPVPVFLKRFAAARFVLIFGIYIIPLQVLVSIHKWLFFRWAAFSAGFRPRRTAVRLGRKPLCGLAHRKNISFMNWTQYSVQI